MKIRKKSAAFLFGVILLGLSSSMLVSATDVLGDVNNQAVQLGNNGSSAPENGLGSDNGSSTKDKLKPQVDKGKNDEAQFAFVGNGNNSNSGAGRSNATKAAVGFATVTALTAAGGAGIYFANKKKNVPGSEETTTKGQTEQQVDDMKSQGFPEVEKKTQEKGQYSDDEDEDEDESGYKSLELFEWIIIVILLVLLAVCFCFMLCIKYIPCCKKYGCQDDQTNSGVGMSL